MTTTRFFTQFIGLLLALVVASCADHLAPGSGPGRLRVKTLTQIVSDKPGISRVSTFTYDEKGRLSTILAFQLPDSTLGPVEQNTYRYDDQNRLVQHRRDIVRRALFNPATPPYETHDYLYNPAGQVTQILYSSNTGGLLFDVKLAYKDNGKLLSSKQRLVGISGISYNANRTYTFTGDNATLVDAQFAVCRTDGSPCPPGTSSTPYTFDDKINPFYGNYVIPMLTGRVIPVIGGILVNEALYGGLDNYLNLSRNNVLTAGDSRYTYTYNTANLPTSRVVTGQYATETLYYTYETY
ncbi:hypothetical protein [Spirosoma utsteinense]|uniref:YD repeat-containing protein n=1 Tax=Spirosoma utsteinense TaxID=2585773 RepID=A0ABR6W9D3_9BACT|nr:hypothetical protein [Spirosoma utsteinense]MBC3787595.1 hypothetical protein [Spirosoma utsteinense]MBC3793191.1 hypothetical protein [Spirosoma utsteinense]